jgi:hypothetical protein
MMLFIVASIGAAVTMRAVTATSQSRQDRSTKRAVAAADAGIDTALYRLNKVVPAADQCVVSELTGLQAERVLSGGWCPAASEDLGDGASYSYRVSGPVTLNTNGQDILQRKIVSTGAVNGVTRRVAVTAANPTATLFGRNTVTSLKKLQIKEHSTVNGDVATNGELKVERHSTLCGNGRFGPAKANKSRISGDSEQCAGFEWEPTEPPLVLAPVDQGNAPTVNDNGRIGTLDPWSKPKDVKWDPVKRTLKLERNSTLTLTGNVYSFCHLELRENSKLIIGTRAAGAPPLKIYIDAPENCPGTGENEPVKLEDKAEIRNLNYNPATLQLFVLGSTNKKKKTRVKIGNDFKNVNMVVYAPNSKVEVREKTVMTGSIAAQEVKIGNKSRLVGDPRTWSITGGLLQIYQRQTWSECTSKATGAAPDAGC